MKKILLFLLSWIVLFPACRKRDDTVVPATPVVTQPPANPPSSVGTTGISGIVSPAQAITEVRVTLVAADGRVWHFSAAPGSDGHFQIASIPAGSCTLDFTAATGYVTPDTKQLMINTQQLSDIGTILVDKLNPGSISGLVSPASPVAKVSVSLYPAGTAGAVYSAVPDAGGQFSIPNLNPGKYFVTVTPAAGSGFMAPYNWPVKVGNGQNAYVGEIRLTSAPPPQAVSAQIGGSTYTASSLLEASYTGTRLAMSVNLKGYTLVLNLEGVTGPGEYHCNKTGGSTATLQMLTLVEVLMVDWMTVMKSKNWSSASSDTGLTVQIVSIDPVTQIITGRFSGILDPTNQYTSGTTTLANGTFSLPYSRP